MKGILSMAKNKKDDFKYEIVEILGTLEQDVGVHGDWCKSVLTTLMNEDTAGIDIRNYNSTENMMGKGIRLSNQEANNLVDLLVKNGYGTLEVLEEEINKRKSLYQ